MSRDDHNINAKDFLMGALIGGIVGGITALLFAPKSGKELREDLNTQSQAVRKKGGDLAVIAKEKSVDLAKTVSQQRMQLMNKVRVLPDYIGITPAKPSENADVNTIELNKDAPKNEAADTEEEK